jgi:basic membrane protein A and related proteins
MHLGPLQTCAALIAAATLLTLLPARRARPRGEEEGTFSARPREERRTRVGLVFDVGGRGDKSFNDAAYAGLERARIELGVEPSFLEPASTEDREAALRLFAARGLDLVIAVGFIFSSDVDTVAATYPSIHFACVDYAPQSERIPPNMEGLAFREEEGAFLVGALAGLMSKTRNVGFIGGMTIPLIRKFEAGYAAGVSATCPVCVVHATYAGSTPDGFKDPAKGKALAIGEIAEGADVLFHASGATGHGVFEAARDAHVLAIGVDADQYDEMPGTVVTSMIKRADVAVFEAIRAASEGRFEGGMHVFGLREGGIDYVHDGEHGALVPRDVKTRVAALREQVIEGSVIVPSR